MKAYKCPVCGSQLTKHRYEHALGIVDEQKKALEAERAQIARERGLLAGRVKAARDDGMKAAKDQTRRVLEGKDKQIERLHRTVQQLQKGVTPQTEGLEFEDALVRRLKREFPGDEVEHKGREGDILHAVCDSGERCGLIVYELKRTKAIQTDHVQQAALAQKQRGADAAVLVTTGTRKGFAGFTTLDGVSVVAPQGVIALVSLIRKHLIEIHHSNLSREQKQLLAKRLIEFLSGAHFKNHLEGVVGAASELQRLMKLEMKDHKRIWEQRWTRYESIQWDSNQVRASLGLIMQGKELQTPKRPLFRAPALLTEQT